MNVDTRQRITIESVPAAIRNMYASSLPFVSYRSHKDALVKFWQELLKTNVAGQAARDA
jgi:hypothetical protein